VRCNVGNCSVASQVLVFIVNKTVLTQVSDSYCSAICTAPYLESYISRGRGRGDVKMYWHYFRTKFDKNQAITTTEKDKRKKKTAVISHSIFLSMNVLLLNFPVQYYLQHNMPIMGVERFPFT
jgi:hypothetical protein